MQGQSDGYVSPGYVGGCGYKYNAVEAFYSSASAEDIDTEQQRDTYKDAPWYIECACVTLIASFQGLWVPALVKRR